MSLRHKIILLLLGSFVCFAAVSWAIITDIVESAFGRVERARIEQAQQRVYTNLRTQLNLTRTLALDWGHWSESHEFVQGRNERFIADNLVDDYLGDLDIDLMFYFDLHGNLVHAQYAESLANRPDTPPLTADALARLLTPRSEDDLLSGMIDTPIGLGLVSAAAVLDSTSAPPAAGVLVLGRLLTGDRIEHLRDATQTEVDIYSASGMLDESLASAMAALAAGDSTVERQTPAELSIYAPLQGLDGEPVGMLRVRVERDEVVLGTQVVEVLLLLLGCFVLITIAVIWFLLRGMLLRPLDNLTQCMQQTESNPGEELTLTGVIHPQTLGRRDEIGQLARAYKGMRAALQNYRAEIWKLAYRDPLTGLPNRRAFIDAIENTAGAAAGDQERFAVLFLDLDDFKQVNDSRGHEAGDRLLQALVERMEQAVAEQQAAQSFGELPMIARLGGDEFVILIKDIEDETRVYRFCKRILAAVSGEYDVGNGDNFRVGISIGIAIFPEDGSNVTELLMSADVAMYNAKHNGKNAFMRYKRSMNEATAGTTRFRRRATAPPSKVS